MNPTIGVQHSSMQFSDHAGQMAHDARALFVHAREAGNVLLTGTEAATATALHELLPTIGDAHGFYVFAHKWGEWVAVDRDWGKPMDHGYRYVLDALHVPASEGGHNPRGITWLEAKPHDPDVAPRVTLAAFHLLTAGSIAAGTQTNRLLQTAAGDVARERAGGRRIAFVNGDVNLHDDQVDVFRGAPLTTCWDELGEYPHTHGTQRAGSTIDVIASYDGDGRVHCAKAHAYTDAELPLYTDHNLIDARYTVRNSR